MRTQLRRQAGAHTDHLRDVLKVQEQEFRGKYKEVHLLYFHGHRLPFQAMLTNKAIIGRTYKHRTDSFCNQD